MKKIIIIVLFVLTQTSYGKEKDIYICGIATGFPPYQYETSNNETAGIDYEITKLVFEKAGLKVKFIQKPWDELLFSLMHNEGKIDFLCGAEISEIRKKVLGFSIPYYERNIVIFTLPQNNINSIKDLYGKTITGDRHSFIERILSKDASKIRIMQTKSKEESFLKLKDGVVHAVIAPLEVGNYFAKKNKMQIMILPGEDPGSQVAFAVYKGDGELLLKINNALKILINEGKIEKMIKKYK